MTTPKKTSNKTSQTTTSSSTETTGTNSTEADNLEQPTSTLAAPTLPTLTLAESPAMAMGMIYMAAAQSQSILFENAVHNQSLAALAAQTANMQGIAQLEKITDASTQAALEKLAAANLVDQILAKKAAATG